MNYLKDNITGEKSLNTFSAACAGGRLVFEFDIKADKLFTPYHRYNDPLYDGDVAEIFITEGDDITSYYEIEVAPNGAVFFAKIQNKWKMENGKTVEFHDGGIIVELLDTCFVKTKVTKTDDGYKVKIDFPQNKIDYKKAKFNAYVIDTSKPQPLFALNPTFFPKFHLRESFISVEEFVTCIIDD